MTNTILSENQKEKRGLNMENINEVIGSTTEDGSKEVELKEDTSVKTDNNNIITQEYIDKTIEDMKTMNFVEINKLKKELLSYQQSFEDAKEFAESMKNTASEYLKDEDIQKSLTDAINDEDGKTKAGIDDIDQFLAEYEDTANKIKQLLDKADEKIKEFDDVEKTTSFLSNAMIDTIDKNLAKINALNNPNMKQVKNYYSELRNIFSNRTDMTWIKDKMKDTKVIVNRTKRSIKKDPKIISNIQKNVTKSFCHVFNVTQMENFEKYLKSLHEEDDDLVFYFQYMLHLIYTKERQNGKYGKHKWVEVLIMNVLDQTIDNYDLPGGKEVLDQEILSLLEEAKSILK